ncbi:MAG: hypothetical protein N2322_07095, partial [Terrimicrobiaceae bacterium]|nr:hypothetical protein [Terrimicrobiaceae bacterium]
PPRIGLLDLRVDGEAVPQPAWDAQGWLWLGRQPPTAEAEAIERDFLGVELYGALEDGIPLWLRIEAVLSAAGKAREEVIGRVLPEGWKLAAVESPIPVAVDQDGVLKAQVRPGQWRVELSAFRLDDPRELKFSPGAAAPSMLLGLRPKPEFRMIELEGAAQVDASQTTFPERWRQLAVFSWPLDQPLKIVERMRGLGGRAAQGLAIVRQWWLDESGQGLTFRDFIRGGNQTLWRLDAARGIELGSVQSGGKGQLITRNPETGAAGFEVRTRSLDVSAVGRMAAGGALPASGWQAAADSVEVTLQLPPGWRLFAVGGADWVRGSWLNKWTLLDVFVLLVITLVVYRLFGTGTAALTFFALALAFHEPGAPRYLWLALLVAVGLLRVVKPGRGREALVWLKWAVVILLGLALTPFSASQL